MLRGRSIRDAAIESVRMDRGAFKRNGDGTWIVTRDTVVIAGRGPGVARFPLRNGQVIGPNQLRPAGIDLTEILELTSSTMR
jgi:hypothetical protein